MSTAKEADRTPAKERRFIETVAVGKDNRVAVGKDNSGSTFCGNCPDGGEAQGSSESSGLGFEDYVKADDDERCKGGIWSRTSGEWREGRHRRREEQGEKEERIGRVSRPQRVGGMRRMVDSHAPLVGSHSAG